MHQGVLIKTTTNPTTVYLWGNFHPMPTRPRFNLKNKNEDSSLILMIFRLKGKRVVYSTGLNISPRFWNDKIMRARTTAGFLEAQSINDKLSHIEEAVIKSDRHFRSHNLSPSIEEFKKSLKLNLNGGEVPSKGSFNAFIESFIEDRSAMSNFAHTSVQIYKTTRNHYFRFIKGNTIEFKDVDLDHLTGFVSYLRRKELGDNTVHKIIATIRTFLNEASKRGLNQNQKFFLRDARVTRRDSDTVYLSREELHALENLDLTKEPRLARVRDLFLTGAFTGLRFSDFTKITNENLKKIDGVEILSVPVSKTQDLVEIPLHPVVKNVLKRSGGKLPKPISNQKLNDYLKEICQLLEMNELITKREYPGGKMIVKKIPKWQLVSSHTARRSFATNAYKAGLDAISIMKITGHKQHSTFMKYIRVSKEENAVRMANHPFFGI